MAQRGSSKGSATVRPGAGRGGCGEYRAGDHVDTIRAMADLPSGEWSQLLVGHQWPGSGSLAILGAAAADRAALGSAYDGYAEILRSVRTGILAAQEGLTADSARQSFGFGESGARDIAARSLAKHASYTSAHQWIAELRADLTAIAASGNSAIRRILDSGDPGPEKISAIVQTVTDAHQQANAKAATCSANVCDAIQSVLATGQTEISARQFARSHGVTLERAFGSPNLEFIHNEVSAMMTAPTGSEPVLSPESLAESLASGISAGAPLSAGTEALTTGAVNAIRESDSDTPAGPLAISPTAVAGAPLSAVAVSPTGSPTTPVATPTTTPAVAAGPLARYGTDLRPAVTTIPPAPTATTPGATPASAPLNAANAPALAHTSVARGQLAATGANAVTAANATAVGAVAALSAARTRLRRLLDAVARQEPLLRWAIGDRRDGSTVLVTDLASGWIPPHIDIPAGVRVLEPGHRSGNLKTLIGDATVMETYAPDDDTVGEWGEAVPISIDARRTTAVDDLGWELTRATRWRSGLPRMAHTVALATVARTGCLDSEIAVLRRHLNAVAHTVLNSYPAAVSAAAIGNWQLLATVDALIDDEKTLADYHFAWFHAHATAGQAAALP